MTEKLFYSNANLFRLVLTAREPIGRDVYDLNFIAGQRPLGHGASANTVDWEDQGRLTPSKGHLLYSETQPFPNTALADPPLRELSSLDSLAELLKT